MSVYAITNKIGDPSQLAIVSTTGRLDFPITDGPLLASLLDAEFPRCHTRGCPDRDVCGGCGFCDSCGCDCDDLDEDAREDEWDGWDEEDERRG